MENNANTEKIANWVIFCFQIFEVDNLWSDISWSSTPHKKILFLFAMSGQTKIGNDTIIVILFSQNDIFWLEVSMHDSLVMHVLQSFKKSLHNCLGLSGGKLMFGLDLIVQLSPL
jgi:hypothetical protein